MIESNKLANLEDLKLIYDDIRDRIKEKYSKPEDGIPASDLAAGVIPDISVRDVQINGESIVQNDVANILPAESSLYGVVKIATDEDILQIIEDYEQGDDEDVLFVANFTYDPDTPTSYGYGCYVTEADAADIASAFEQGKHVVVKLNFNEAGGSDPSGYMLHTDMYLAMTGYIHGYEDSGHTYPDTFFFAPARDTVWTDDGSYDIYSSIRNPHVIVNGKLRFDIVAD